MALLHIENNGIATVSLNRPDKRNAMSFALLRELVSVAQQIKKDRSIRVVILTVKLCLVQVLTLLTK
jgi:enoyl-CoA hydratase/carnithine racemase